MEFGIKLASDQAFPLEDGIGRLALAAEDLGFDTVWVADHVAIPCNFTLDAEHSAATEFGRRNWADPLISLTWVAAQTSRIKIGTAVLVPALRNPLVTAKMLATLDVLSRGRLVIGVGVGWLAEEFAAVGAPSYAQRGAVTHEWLAIFRKCWSEERPTFEGRHYRFDPIHFYPKPISSIPIWVGGNSARALHRAGVLGDGWHGTRVEPAQIPIMIDKVRQVCIGAGRDPAALSFGVGLEFDLLDDRDEASTVGLLAPPERGLIGTKDEICRKLEQLQVYGIKHVELRFRTARDPQIKTVEPTLDMMDRFAREIMPAFR